MQNYYKPTLAITTYNRSRAGKPNVEFDLLAPKIVRDANGNIQLQALLDFIDSHPELGDEPRAERKYLYMNSFNIPRRLGPKMTGPITETLIEWLNLPLLERWLLAQTQSEFQLLPWPDEYLPGTVERLAKLLLQRFVGYTADNCSRAVFNRLGELGWVPPEVLALPKLYLDNLNYYSVLEALGVKTSHVPTNFRYNPKTQALEPYQGYLTFVVLPD